jgi:hypothetical protein
LGVGLIPSPLLICREEINMAANDSEDMYAASSSSAPTTPFKDTRLGKGLAAGGKSLSQSGQDMISGARDQAAANANRQTTVPLPSYRKGGRVKKTGPAKLHRGEVVVPKKKAREAKKLLKKRKSGREM